MARRCYPMVLGTLVVVLTMFLTFRDSLDLRIVLKEQLAVGLPLLLLGMIALVFKAPTLRVCVLLGQLTRLADDDSQGTGAQQLADCGRWALWTGVAIVLASIAFYAVVYHTPSLWPDYHR